ncbi:hypothetical protein AVEN_13368-1, partial [Araneus ventricosus]
MTSAPSPPDPNPGFATGIETVANPGFWSGGGAEVMKILYRYDLMAY